MGRRLSGIDSLMIDDPPNESGGFFNAPYPWTAASRVSSGRSFSVRIPWNENAVRPDCLGGRLP